MPYELSVRKSDWGRGVVPVATKFPGDRDPASGGHTELIFFVHGYNNTLSTAERVWRRFTFRRLLDGGVSKDRLREVVLFYWPGDFGRYQLPSAPFYPLMIKPARQTADELAKYLTRLRGPGGVDGRGRRFPV